MLFGIVACTGNSVPIREHNQTPADINAQLGLGYMRQGNLDLALEKLTYALKHDSKNANAHHYIAILYRERGNAKQAEKHFQKALKLRPKEASIYNNYGVFLCDQGDIETAEEYFLRAINMSDNPRQDEAYENMGLCAMRIPDKEMAENYFRQALQTNPVLTKSLYQMALIQFDSGEYLSARAFIQRFRAVTQHTPHSLWLGVRVERELGDNVAVMNYSAELMENYPDTQEAQWLLEMEHRE